MRGARRPRTDFFLRAESYFNLASEIEALDLEPGGGPPIIANYGGRSLHEQSHGQSFLALLVHRFGPDGLYILDEPEAALSPQGQLALLARMHELVAEGCQFMIATHSPILLSFPDARIYQLSEDGIASVSYDDTETVRCTDPSSPRLTRSLHYLEPGRRGGLTARRSGATADRDSGRCKRTAGRSIGAWCCDAWSRCSRGSPSACCRPVPRQQAAVALGWLAIGPLPGESGAWRDVLRRWPC